MLNGIYSISFAGSTAAGTGVVIIDGVRIMGGDAAFVYRGKYRRDDKNGITAVVEVEKHNDTRLSIFGDLTHFRLNLNGVVQSDGKSLTLSGQVEGQPRHMIVMNLTKLGDLIDEEK